MPAIKLAVVADIHHGRDTRTKRGSAALSMLHGFVDTTKADKVDAVIDLGDRISDESAERDRILQDEVASEFARLEVPVHHLDGNHDVAKLTPSERLGGPALSRTVELGDLRLVLWQPNVRLVREHGLRLAAGDLDWLSHTLGKDPRRTLLFSHVPLSGHPQTGNYYFEHCPDRATYLDDLPPIRRVLAEAPCPLACFAGHVHWNTLTVVDGIPHVTLQALTETFTTGEPAGCTALLTVHDEELEWSVSGLDPIALRLAFPRLRRRWLAGAGAALRPTA